MRIPILIRYIMHTLKENPVPPNIKSRTKLARIMHDIVVESLKSALDHGESVPIRGLGTFETEYVPERRGFKSNLFEGPIDIAARTRIRFKTSRSANKRVSSLLT